MNDLPNDLPRDLADMLGRIANNVAPRSVPPLTTPPAVEVVHEDGFWAVFLHGKEIGRIERNTDEGGYYAISNDDGDARHVMSFSRAKEVLIGDAI